MILFRIIVGPYTVWDYIFTYLKKKKKTQTLECRKNSGHWHRLPMVSFNIIIVSAPILGQYQTSATTLEKNLFKKTVENLITLTALR